MKILDDSLDPYKEVVDGLVGGFGLLLVPLLVCHALLLDLLDDVLRDCVLIETRQHLSDGLCVFIQYVLLSCLEVVLLECEGFLVFLPDYGTGVEDNN